MSDTTKAPRILITAGDKSSVVSGQTLGILGRHLDALIDAEEDFDVRVALRSLANALVRADEGGSVTVEVVY